MKKLIFLILMTLMPLINFGQIDPTDACGVGVNTLTVGSTCTVNNYNMAGNFTNGGAVNASCATTGNDRDDGWYRFQATNTTTTITTTADIAFVVAIFTGSCGTGELACDSRASGVASTITITTTIGTWYYIQIHRRGGNNSAAQSGTICLESPVVCTAPVTQATNFTSSVITNTTATIGWTRGSGNIVMIIARAGSAPTDPVSGTAYTANAAYGSGTAVGGGFCVYNGTGTSVPLTGLVAGTTYHFAIYEYNTTGNCYNLVQLTGNLTTTSASACSGIGATSVITLPFNSGNVTTCGAGNDFQSTTLTNVCGSTFYYNGEEVVYEFTPTITGQIDISLTSTGSYTGLMLYNGCPRTGTCVGFNQSSTGSKTLSCMNVTSGVKYYLIVDSWPAPTCNAYSLTINAPVPNSIIPTCNMNYTITSIPYNIPSLAGTALTFGDDEFASSYTPITFNFCFDGVNYNRTLVSSNGHITFDGINCIGNLPTGSALPGSYSPWSFTLNIPNTTSAPRNSIMIWQDLDPAAGGAIITSITGTAPNRVFRTTFNGVPMFSAACDANNSLDLTAQIMLYETTNIIEIHIQNKGVCPTWNSGNAILGLHNFDGTFASVPTGYNAASPDWSVTNLAWRFTPPAGCCNPLPINVLELKTENINNIINLTWNNKNKDSINIYYSTNGKEFNKIITTTTNNYSYKTNNNENYFYIENIKDDIKSDIRLVEIENDNVAIIKPNPFNNNLNIECNGTWNITILNSIGSEIYSNKFDNNLIIDTKNFSKGTYIIILEDNWGNNIKNKYIKID